MYGRDHWLAKERPLVYGRGFLAAYGPPTEALEHFGVQDFSDIYTKIEKDPEALGRLFACLAARGYR